jgi:oligopeptide transport system ATP-binding protein
MKNILEVNNLNTNFVNGNGTVKAVRGISMNIARGESVGVVGESGCGKSVTMLSILRLLDDNARINADSISFENVDLLKKDKGYMRGIQGNKIGMVFQDPLTSLNPLFTVGNQLIEPLLIHKKMSKKEAEAKAVNLLNLVGIPSPEKRLKQYPHEFSGGMRQRIMIAIAMSCEPSLLIADEPTTALDVTIQAQILELMLELKNKYSTSIILITHDLGVISSMCSRVIVMYGGLVVEEGPIDDIFYNTAHPYTRGLLNSIPKIEGSKKEKLIPIHGSPPDLLNPPEGCPFVDRCDYAMNICKHHQPSLVNVSDEHKSACWLLHSKASAFCKGGIIHA